MRVTLCLLIIGLLVRLPLSASAGVVTIGLRASRSAVLNDGRDFNEIIADVRDGSGGIPPDGTIVTFNTDKGIFFGSNAVPTRGGTTRVRVTSLQKGVANVVATVNGGGFQQIAILFTDDVQETVQGNTFASVVSSGSNVYYPGSRIIEAVAKSRPEGSNEKGGVVVTYRNWQLSADRVQIDCNMNVVKASGNVLITRGTRKLICRKLFLPMGPLDGFAIVDTAKTVSVVRVRSLDLGTETPKTGVPPIYFQEEDTERESQAITARVIRLFPGEKLQFAKAKFYLDRQAIVSMMTYSLSLSQTQLFADQLFTVSEGDFNLDIPLFYEASPTSTGTLHITHGGNLGRSNFVTVPGWSLSAIHAYNSLSVNNRFSGQVSLIGVPQDDWGVRWSHSQSFSPTLLGSFYADLSRHRNIFLSSNLNKQLGMVSATLNLTGNRSITGVSVQGEGADVNLETIPKKIGSTGYSLAVGGTASLLNARSPGFSSNVTSQSLQSRIMSRGFHLGKDTQITNYYTFSNTWGTGVTTGTNVLGSLTGTRPLGRSGSLTLTYDYASRPLYAASSGNHRLSTNLSYSKGNRWSLYLFGSSMVDAQQVSIVSDLNYQISQRWRLNLATTHQDQVGSRYSDYILGAGYNVGGRDVVVSYSTYTRRFYVELQSSRF